MGSGGISDVDRERDGPTAADTARFAAMAEPAVVFLPLTTVPLPDGVRQPVEPAVPSRSLSLSFSFSTAEVAFDVLVVLVNGCPFSDSRFCVSPRVSFSLRLSLDLCLLRIVLVSLAPTLFTQPIG